MARVRNRRGDGAALRAELIAAADAVLDDTGDPDRVTVRGVAGAVGVAPNAVYLHFADRDSLLTELAIARFEVCRDEVIAAVADIDDPLEALLVGHETYCRLALDRPGHYRLLFDGRLRPADPDRAHRLAEAGLRYFEVCVAGCQACLDTGVLDGDDAAALAGSIWALQHGWCELALAGMSDLLADPRAVLRTLLGAGPDAGVGGA